MNLTIWEYSEKTEAERLLHCAHQMAVGFYRVNNFIVLPYLSKLANVHTVSFPSLNYHKIPRFWEKVKPIDIVTLPIKADADLVSQTMQLLKTAGLPQSDYSNIQKIWAKAENEVLDTVYKIMPDKKGLIRKILIYPTNFGTSTSFNLIDKKGNVVLYLRQGQGLAAITEAIITSITRADIFENLGGMWQESEIITDWLVTHTALEKVIKKYDPISTFLGTLKGVRITQQAKLLEESDNYYKKLGLPVNQSVFRLNGLIPEINKKPVENLSPTERMILKILIEKNGLVATFDELGNQIFKNEDDYSLYAISKNIERLRNKLEANGISGSYIQTLRGKGYLLKN